MNTVIRAKATSCQNTCIYVTGQYVHVGRDIFPLRFYVLIKLLNDVQFGQKMLPLIGRTDALSFQVMTDPSGHFLTNGKCVLTIN